MEIALTNLLKRHGDRVQKVLNILIESPYFYAVDDHDSFLYLRRHRADFVEFFKLFYGWALLIDSKCARVYKAEWHNTAITPANRSLFSFSKRDDCLAFMILLEFFEQQLEENGMTVEDKQNLRFHFGDLLDYSQKRFVEIFPDKHEDYSQDKVRDKIWKSVMPELEKHRFLTKIKPPEDLQATTAELIFEAMPALYHYNGAALSRTIPEMMHSIEVKDV
ncbi:DUF2398 family protein [Desulfosediminicola sp.]|uniref:DUF2398 family protein n=1 Tax=Desulfosediminicola sp. TaxID=2886825 RepID=UPI003AF2FCD9